MAHELLRQAKEVGIESGLKRVLGESRESNEKMRRVFEDCGFKVIDKVLDYYRNPDEAAVKYSFVLK
ncbi:MAG: hypothetical protein GX219_06675 [Tissierellia bacterium]|nr:hypothetical protein [Tissierellia bacterium]